MNVPCEQLTNKKGLWCAWSIWQDVGQELHIQKNSVLQMLLYTSGQEENYSIN